MRIIAGQWRGRRIETPAGQSTRPTADRIRETLFSMLVSRIGSLEDLRVADLFAGSGALGFEALSRGAAHATFVDRDPKAIAAIRANAEKLGATDRVRIMASSALALPRSEPFDLLFADAPYAPGSGNAAAAAVMGADWLAPGGLLVVETERKDPVAADGLELVAERQVGKARLSFLSRPSTPS